MSVGGADPPTHTPERVLTSFTACQKLGLVNRCRAPPQNWLRLSSGESSPCGVAMRLLPSCSTPELAASQCWERHSCVTSFTASQNLGLVNRCSTPELAASQKWARCPCVALLCICSQLPHPRACCISALAEAFLCDLLHCLPKCWAGKQMLHPTPELAASQYRVSRPCVASLCSCSPAALHKSWLHLSTSVPPSDRWFFEACSAPSSAASPPQRRSGGWMRLTERDRVKHREGWGRPSRDQH